MEGLLSTGPTPSSLKSNASIIMETNTLGLMALDILLGNISKLSDKL